MSSSSSSTALWATASKEWVIQPKPKPGRKPKKDPATTLKDDNEVDAKGRRFQNRAAQRAFRERKQSQLSELQARIQSYEQGEIERNVALQNIAKRLKEENDKLRQENIALQSKLAQICLQLDQSRSQALSPATDKKRGREESPSTTLSVQPSAKKKTRKTLEPDHAPVSVLSASHLPSPTSMASTPDSNDTADTHFSPHPYDAQSDMDNSAFDNFNHLTSDGKGGNDVLGSFSSFGCGFCDGGAAICVCHEIAVHDVVDRSLSSNEFKPNEFNDAQLLPMHNEATLETPVQTDRPSILNNLPAYQPPIPIRRRTGGVPVNSVFPVAAMRNTSAILDANCSGDPSNCLACGDDAFGKAFCDAIGNTTLAQEGCSDCPESSSTSQCCNHGSNDGSKCICNSTSSTTLDSNHHADTSAEFIPTNDAWQKLKAHPNVEFADLSLLAEVVASRSKCSGPRLVITPSTQNQPPNNGGHAFDNEQIYGQQQRRRSPPPRLVPQEILLECGRRRFRHVHADGVREALRLLDAKFS